jgi:hypothetical protein
MKRLYIYVSILAATLSVAVATAREAKPQGVDVSRAGVTVAGDSVKVTLRATVQRRALKVNETMIFRPVIADETYRVSMPEVMVHGGHIARVSSKRRTWAIEGAMTARRGREFEYSASVPAQYWMRKADLFIESAVAGCCCIDYNDTCKVADDILAGMLPELHDTIVHTTTMTPPPFVPRTTAEVLSVTHPFVVPDDEYDPREPFRIYDDSENAIIVYFRQGRSVIEPAFSTNLNTLSTLVSAIDRITRSTDSRVTRVLIGGFASPEGSFADNDRLAWRRAAAVKAYVVDHTNLSGSQVVLYNGSEDWRGLRKLVAESNMEYRDEVLYIIDNTPVWDSGSRTGRQGEIMRLRGGVPYRYMYRNFFPLLRNGAFIKVYYKNNE